MESLDVTAKKSVKTKIQEAFTQFISLFIKKTKVLDQAPVELTEELKEVEAKYKEITKEDSFENLKETYNLYKVGVNPTGGLTAVEKNTGYVKEDKKFVARVRFVALWRKSAYGNFDSKDEENCYDECFSAESEIIYNKLKDLIETQLKKTGNIDTKAVLEEMKQGDEKWIRVTSRRLFRTTAYSETVTDYFRSIMKRPKRQTKPTLSLSQALYGVDEI